MHDAIHGRAVLSYIRPWTRTANATSWVPVWSLPAAMRAVRSVIVVAGLFALCDEVIGNLQMATFAAFGGFATLVLASFAGRARDKLLAHAALAIAGSVLLTIGTLVSSSTALAALVTVPVTFAVFYAGIAGPNAASGVTGALLAYVLPAASPAAVGMIPDRLAGWWMASVAGTAAVLMLSPRRERDGLRDASSKLAVALADELAAWVRGSATADTLQAVVTAKRELIARFTDRPYRPTGLGTADQALASTVELLRWCAALVEDALRERDDLRDAPDVERELLDATAVALRDAGATLADGKARPDLEGLERRQASSLASPAKLAPATAGFRAAVKLSFHAYTISVVARGVSAESLVAARLAAPDWVADARRRWYAGSEAVSRTAHRLSSITAEALRHASLRSVWFLNSARGAIALAAAVAAADLSSVQHGFWVVLGTLSVLRTNAASTGSSAARALVGTAIGLVIGGALLLAIGTDSAALWIVLPIAVFIAAYTPGTAPFAIGQAAFTVTVAVLFNLLAPAGWKVGLLRIEDVAIGCAVSLVVGVLFWPRGVSSVVGDDLADAFRTGASYLRQAVLWASGLRALESQLAMASVTAASRLDEALRGYMAEQGAKHVEMQELWRLVGGSLRLRLTARSITELPREPAGIGAARAPLEHRTAALSAWYEQLAGVVGKPRGQRVPALEPPAFDAGELDACGPDSFYGIWLCEHLHHLSEHLDELVGPAARIAERRRAPWWT